MEMTINEIEFALNSIKIVLEHTEKGYYPEQFKTHKKCLKKVMNIAHKYQKIKKIVNNTFQNIAKEDERYAYEWLGDIKEVLDNDN